jgi:ABC-type phosphate transport system substrate-binding protein
MAFLAISTFSAIPVQAQTPLLSAGQLKVYGSSTIYPITDYVIPTFQTYVATLPAPFTATTVTTNALGSGSGFNALKASPPTADIAQSSESGQSIGLYTSSGSIADPQEFKIGSDSIAIIVPDTNTWLSQGSASGLADLFITTANGNEVPKYATWGDWASAQVPAVTLPTGVATQTIGRIGRVYSSGTFDGFNTFFLNAFGHNMKYNIGTGQTAEDWLPGNYQPYSSNAEVLSAIQQSANQYAIAFIGLGFVQNDLGATHPNHIIPLKLFNPTTGQYISPSIANVKAGLYVNNKATPAVIMRPLFYFMDGIPSASSAAAVKSLWISFVKSDPDFIAREGYITMNRIDFAGAPSGNTDLTKGTQTVPDGSVDFYDITYFADAWIAFYGTSNSLNPYADITGPHGRPDGQVGFEDVTSFADNWILAYS